MLNKLVLVLLLFVTSYGQECIALSLEGGGGRGAYEAGVLSVLTNATYGINVKYQVVSGVSIGAVGAGLVCQYPIGQEAQMSQNMLDFWYSLNGSSSIFVEWPGGLIDGLLFHAGLVTNAPAVALSQIWMKTPCVKKFSVGSTNLDLGIFQTFNESLGLAIRDAIVSSGSIPFMFPPHEFEGYSWADGGCIINQDVFSAIERCFEITTDQKSITVDAIFDDPSSPLPPDTKFKTVDVFERAYTIHSLDSSIWYTYNTMAAFPDVNYRYVLMPSESIQPLLNFSKSSIEFDVNLGVKDALNAIKSGKDGKTVIRELYQDLKSRIIYP